MDKQKISLAIKKLFFKAGLYGVIRRLKPNHRVAILRYHAVVSPEKNFYTSPAIGLSPEEFETHVRYFARRYRVLSLDELVDCLQQKRPLPPNSVVFTFDDGYADNLEAARILHRCGAGGTFFITTEPIGRKSRLWLAEVTYLILKTAKPQLLLSVHGEEKRYPLEDTASRWTAIRAVVRTIKSNNLSVRENIRCQILEQLGEVALLKEVEDLILTWEQVREMQNMGMIIASHTTTHLNLPNADREDAVREIRDAKTVLEEQLGREARHFSYPNSGPYHYYNPDIRQMVIEAGYHSSCTSNNGFVDQHSDLFALERVRTVPELAEVVHDMEWGRIFGG